MNTFDRLKKLLSAVMPDADLSGVTAESKLADIGVNSITMLLLALSMEEEFGMKLDSIAPDDFVTVGDIMTFVDANATK